MVLIFDYDCFSRMLAVVFEYNRKRNKFGTTNAVHLRAIITTTTAMKLVVSSCRCIEISKENDRNYNSVAVDF